MTGTPSRTTTAYDSGKTRCSFEFGTLAREQTEKPRGCVGRKLKAKLRSEEHKPHMRRPKGGRGCLAIRSPKSSGPQVVNAADMWSEGHASYPGRSVCLLGMKGAKEAVGVAVKEVPAGWGDTPRHRSERRVKR